jgi:hypothetical protein
MGAIKPFTLGIVLTVLFSFFMFLGIIGLIQSNNPTAAILTDGETNVSQIIGNFNSSLKQFERIANDARTTLNESEPSATEYLFLIARSMWAIPKSLFTVMIGGSKMILDLISLELFGVGTDTYIFLFITIIFSIIVLSGILYILSAIRSGSVER